MPGQVSRVFDEDPRCIAVVRLRTGLGDLLCTVPALRALRARLPDAHIALVTFEEMRPVVERMSPWVDELIPFPGHPGIPERKPQRVGIADFYTRARARELDLALQMYGANPVANEITARLGARRTGGFFVPGTWPADLSTHLPYPVRRPEVWRHLDLMRHLGAEPAGDHLELPLSPADERSAVGLMAAAGLEPRGFAVLHPGATSESRRWPVERFAAVGDALRRRGLRLAITGVPSEAPLASALAGAMRHEAADLCGRTTLGSLAALLRHARLLVANDTGSAHVAAALGVPSVTVFLSGDPQRWAAPDRRLHRVARVEVECNPCPHLTCPIDHRCAERLDARGVLGHVDDLLAARGPTTARTVPGEAGS
jgi:ADP-heptose:LPS heptosyltransferase